jgi:hypothetical protein
MALELRASCNGKVAGLCTPRRFHIHPPLLKNIVEGEVWDLVEQVPPFYWGSVCNDGACL